MGLAEAAKGFADGEDPREKLDGGGIHEVEALAETFTSMFARTQKHRLLIEEQNRTLEAKVLERTEELRQKNLALAFQNEKVLEASRLKSQFLANVSHELRTPLNGVLALSEMLKEKLSGPLNEEQMEHVLLIHKSGATLLSLINEILDLSRVESGHLEVTPRNVKILEFLKGEAESLRVLADAKGLKFEVVAQTRDEAEVSVDPDRIRQVMVNLIGNALKFTDNGVVRVILEKIHEGSTLRVTVQDTGIGIPDEHHATIFQEFRQVDGSATRRHGGTGLGLAIGRKLVNLMGGEIWVNSVKDRGSTFSFVVPLATGRWPAATVGRVVAGTSSRHRDAGDGDHVPQVLIVEDDQVETSLMSRDLRRRGIDVLMAFDGDEALRVLRGSSPDLILLDLLLPRIDGFGFLESLSIIPGAADIPIVVNTAKVLSDQERRFLESRVRAVHIKGGTDPNRLLQEIQEILGREAVEREKPAAA
jgi:signal transduction histidine kinase